MARIHRKSTVASTESEAKKFQRLLDNIRGDIFAHPSFKEVAKTTSIAQSTIQRFACGYTKSPHLLTIVKLLNALGKGHLLEKAVQSDAPVDKKEGKKLWKELKMAKKKKS